jgi:hypothetical protein
VEGDHLGDRRRPLDHRRQLVTDVDVLPVALLGAERLLRGVDRVDPLVVLVGVVRRLDRRVLPRLARLLALGEHPQDAVHAEDLAVLVDGDVAAHLDQRAAGELGVLDLARLLPVEAEHPIAGAQRAEPLPRAAGDEHVHAAEHALGLRLDLGGDRVAEHRRLDVPDHRAVADLRAPARRRAVVLLGVQRVVVTDTERPVAQRVRRGRRVQLAVPAGDVDPQKQAGLLDVFVNELVLQRLYELLLQILIDAEGLVDGAFGLARILTHGVPLG